MRSHYLCYFCVHFFISQPDLEDVCTFFGLCVVSAFSMLLGVLFFFYCFSCCIPLLSASIVRVLRQTSGQFLNCFWMVFFRAFVAVFLNFVLLTSLELTAVHLPY